MACIVVAMLASVYSARVLDGNVHEHCAWPLVGCTGVCCRIRSRRIHHSAQVHGRARAVFR
jgi:hypothetical protein